MKKSNLIAVGFSVILFICSCAITSQIAKLPKTEEFTKELSKLLTEYPGLTNYSSLSRDWFVTIYVIPEVEPLIKACNDLQKTRLNVLG